MDSFTEYMPQMPPGSQHHGQGKLRMPMTYPSPFFDISKFYLPPTVKELFKWCRYYYKTSELIHPVIYKMAEYPVTDLVFEPEDEEGGANQGGERLEQILQEDFAIKSLLIEIGLDYFTYGNAFVSIYFPFKRFLVCKSCKEKNQFEDFKEYGPKGDLKFQKFEFKGICPKCGSNTNFEVEDVPVKQLRKINLVRIPPDQIDIEHHGITGISHYYYNISGKDRRRVLEGNYETLKTLPWLFIQAVKEKKKVKLNPSSFYHFKRADISDGDDGWGMPLVLPVMRNMFYLNVLRKAQEAIAFEHLVPLRILFPTDNQGAAAPHIHTGLGDWKNNVERAIRMWKQDPNYIPVMPIPLGFQQIGGDGKMLLLTQEIRQVQESIVNGMTVPQEFVFGGLSWSGSSISLRMLENHFLVYRQDLLKFLDFVSKKISSFLDIKPRKIKMQEFKMADDIQRKQLFMQLNSLAKISDSTMLKEIAGIDAKGEAAQIAKDLVARYTADKLLARQQGLMQAKTQGLIVEEQAEAQRRVMEIQSRGDNESPPADSRGSWADLSHMLDQELLMQEQLDEIQQNQGGTNSGIPMDPQTVAAYYAQQLMEYPAEARGQILNRMQNEMPELAAMVEEYLGAAPKVTAQAPTPRPQTMSPSPEVIDMSPAPEKLPPRRGADKAVI